MDEETLQEEFELDPLESYEDNCFIDFDTSFPISNRAQKSPVFDKQEYIHYILTRCYNNPNDQFEDIKTNHFYKRMYYFIPLISAIVICIIECYCILQLVNAAGFAREVRDFMQIAQNIETNEIDEFKKIFKAQCPAICTRPRFMEDEDMIRVMAIGYKYDRDYLLDFVDHCAYWRMKESEKESGDLRRKYDMIRKKR